MIGEMRGMSAWLVCPHCGCLQFLASGLNAMAFDAEKFKACADRLGWRWDPPACPTCVMEEGGPRGNIRG